MPSLGSGASGHPPCSFRCFDLVSFKKKAINIHLLLNGDEKALHVHHGRMLNVYLDVHIVSSPFCVCMFFFQHNVFMDYLGVIIFFAKSKFLFPSIFYTIFKLSLQ